MRPLPRAVRPGDKVAVVACSSPYDPDDLRRGVAWWRGRCTVPEDPRWFARDGYLAGPDALRAASLVTAVTDPEVCAVLAARGGYGAMRVLERAGETVLQALQRNPRPVVGFSDVTALHALALRAGARSVHGTMVAAIGRGGAGGDELWGVLQGAVPGPWEGLETWVGGTAEGMAMGGNLAILAALAGTPWQVDCTDAVLFIEDVTERPYRLDRMLTTLRLSGSLRGVRAVVVGGLTDCVPGSDGTTAEAVVRERLGELGVPVVAGAPFGHGERNRPWVQGAPVRVSDGAVVHREGTAG